MEELKVSIIQSDLIWEQPDQNRKAFENKIVEIGDASDLVVLPEMFTTGFSMRSEQMAETMEGPTVDWLREKAAKHSTAIAGSIIIKSGEKYFNRMLFATKDGMIEYYDKRHLFRMADEDQSFSEGDQKKIVALNGWKINLQICYDLRFPVWSRNAYQHTEEGLQAAYDVMIYAANWPKPRMNAWDVLLKARAIENQCYVIGVNRVGYDMNDREYIGHSAIIDPKGRPMEELSDRTEGVAFARLSYEELASYRKKFPVGLDAD